MDRVGTALIGLGKVAETHARALASLPRSRFVAVYDPLPERAETFASRYGVTPYTSLDRLLDDPEIDAVSVCTPHPTHAAIAIQAALAGRHVLVEKPMAVTPKDCDGMIRAASSNGVKLAVISQRRLYEPVVRVKEAVAQGRIGEPALGTLEVLGWRSPEYYLLDPWRGTWAGEGGGVLPTQATHHLDLFQWLMGRVVEVFGHYGNLNHPTIEVEDTAVAVLRFANGALGSIVASNSQKPGLFGRIHVHGSNGASVGVQVESGSAFISGVTTAVDPPINDIWTVPGEESLLGTWQSEDRARSAVVDIMTAYHRRQIEDFLSAVIDDREPMVTGEEGRKSVELFSAIYRSHRLGLPVTLPLAPESETPETKSPTRSEA